jgi:hypothetical protein
MKNTYLVKHETGMKNYRQLVNCQGKIFQKDYSGKGLYLRLVFQSINLFKADFMAVVSFTVIIKEKYTVSIFKAT